MCGRRRPGPGDLSRDGGRAESAVPGVSLGRLCAVSRGCRVSARLWAAVSLPLVSSPAVRPCCWRTGRHSGPLGPCPLSRRVSVYSRASVSARARPCSACASVGWRVFPAVRLSLWRVLTVWVLSLADASVGLRAVHLLSTLVFRALWLLQSCLLSVAAAPLSGEGGLAPLLAAGQGRGHRSRPRSGVGAVPLWLVTETSRDGGGLVPSLAREARGGGGQE